MKKKIRPPYSMVFLGFLFLAFSFMFEVFNPDGKINTTLSELVAFIVGIFLIGWNITKCFLIEKMTNKK